MGFFRMPYVGRYERRRIGAFYNDFLQIKLNLPLLSFFFTFWRIAIRVVRRDDVVRRSRSWHGWIEVIMDYQIQFQ